MIYIYGIQHNKTRRIYIGRTGRAERINEHFALLKAGCHNSEQMQRDYYTFGDDFSVYLIEIVAVGNGSERETYWMNYFDTGNPEHGYNVQDPQARKVSITSFPFFAPRFELEHEASRRALKAEAWHSHDAIKSLSETPFKSGHASYAVYAEYRKRARLRDADVSRLLAIPKSTISSWKNGVSSPKAEKLMSICDLLDIPMGDLFNDERETLHSQRTG